MYSNVRTVLKELTILIAIVMAGAFVIAGFVLAIISSVLYK